MKSQYKSIEIETAIDFVLKTYGVEIFLQGIKTNSTTVTNLSDSTIDSNIASYQTFSKLRLRIGKALTQNQWFSLAGQLGTYDDKGSKVLTFTTSGEFTLFGSGKATITTSVNGAEFVFATPILATAAFKLLNRKVIV